MEHETQQRINKCSEPGQILTYKLVEQSSEMIGEESRRPDKTNFIT